MIFGNDFLVPIHSPTSGRIENISFISDPSNKCKKSIKIIVLSDFLDKSIRLKPIKNYKKCIPKKLIKIIYQSGVVGLGGGQFSSAKKLILSLNKSNTLIVNAVESEPFVTSDDCLIKNFIQEILIGCKIIIWISKIKNVLIAIQEDKIESISKIHDCIKNESCFKMCIIKQKYPSGSSKVLIKSLTGKEIPYQKHSVDIGYLIFNVATVYAIKRAIINGEPLIKRIITFLGDKNNFHGNFWVRMGTPIKYFLAEKTLKNKLNIKICLGGPIMGKEIFHLNYSITKNINCIQIQSQSEINNSIITSECIRCGYCSTVCPVNLLPQQLYWYIKNNHFEQIEKYHILDCIECKACEKVCPSYIPLVKYFKYAKIIQNNINEDKNRKKLALLRFESRQIRLLNEKKFFNQQNINYKSVNLENNKKLNTLSIKNINFDKNFRKKMILEAIARSKLKQ